ncbi:hypothetical protein [Caldalkalibacillus mannanilyticus]|uniref:hypothetical protein n=1 Tax=Caldalkalibacillus mannanilyticus TaxID=1418 RepID=UPI000AE0B557|nr:hypothetical protein [Caldalkalibacillus mannanilyticus]
MAQLPPNTPRLSPSESVKFMQKLSDPKFAQQFSSALKSGNAQKIAKTLQKAGIKVSKT